MKTLGTGSGDGRLPLLAAIHGAKILALEKVRDFQLRRWWLGKSSI